uniref:Uncharacterized protein n=2 Tax=Cyprinus carpio TaxID=7962 RepID=A0A8C0YKX0_CYPCA
MDRPMAWAVAFVARRAKSVALRRSRKAGSLGLDSSRERRSFQHDVSVNAASAWGLPRQKTHSPWPSSSCRGALHVPQLWRGMAAAVKTALETLF